MTFAVVLAVRSTVRLNGARIVQVLHACGQIDIVRRKLGEIIQRDVGRDTSACVVKTVIEQHQKIISFAGNIEDLFSYVTLVQFVSNTLVICCLGFLIMLVSKVKMSKLPRPLLDTRHFQRFSPSASRTDRLY